MIRRLVRRAGSKLVATMGVASALLVAGIVVPAVVHRQPTAPFCSMGLAINDEGLALEDQGGSGPGRCDMDVERWLGVTGGKLGNVLGLDCKIYGPGMVVVATTTPNRPDGLCGQTTPLRDGDQG